MTLATVDPISEEKPWSAKAAAGDALQRVPHDKPFFAMWFAEDGSLHYSKANTDFASLSMMAMYATEMAQVIARIALERSCK